jgi:K+-sensing histidine kinase KdpD
VLTALVAGQLAAMLRQQAEAARHREREALALLSPRRSQKSVKMTPRSDDSAS